MSGIDSLLHAWYIARSVGQDIELDPALADFAINVGEQIPDDEDRNKSGAHFGPRVPLPYGETALGRVLALFGR